MAKLRPRPAYQFTGSRPPVKKYDLATGESFNAGDAVELDGSQEVVEVTGADPSTILGFAAADADGLVEAANGRIPVWIATEDAIFAMQGDNDPVASDVDQEYGIIEDGDGIYTVDGSDASNTRLYVVDVDTNRNLYFVKVLEANRQISA